MRTNSRLAALLSLVVCHAAFVAAAPAATLYSETFDTDAATTGAFNIAYPSFTTVTPTKPFTVVGGVVTVPGVGANDTSTATRSGFGGEVIISADVGANISNGSYNVGLMIGGNNVVFHPGHSTGGSLRVEGTGGFGNTQLSFLPANGVLHHIEVHQHPGGLFEITVTDGNNPSNVDSTLSWTNPASVGGSIGLRRSGGLGTAPGEGLYDNLLVEEADWFNAVTAASPLHWYRMDEQSGTTARDLGSGGLHGTYGNGTLLDQAGQVNPAARFDGVNDQVALGGSNLAGDWTAEFLVNKQGIEDAGSLLFGPNGALRLDQWNTTGQVGFTEFGNADFLLTPAVSAPIGNYIHLTYVADSTAGQIDVYVNGYLAGTNANYIPLPRNTIGGGDAPNALIDEVVIYDRLLSETEILTHAFAAGIPEPSTFALAAWGLLAIGLRRRRRAAMQGTIDSPR